VAGGYVEPVGGYPDLGLMHKGQWVRYAQELLQGLGYSLGANGADGFYGPDTEDAVRLFQEQWVPPDPSLAAGELELLPLSVDGVIGGNTWRALGALDRTLEPTNDVTFVVKDAPSISGLDITWTMVSIGNGRAPAQSMPLGQVGILDFVNEVVIDIHGDPVQPFEPMNQWDVEYPNSPETVYFDVRSFGAPAGKYQIWIIITGETYIFDVDIP